MRELLRVLLKCFSLAPAAYLVVVVVFSLIHSSPEHRPQFARIALIAGNLASILFLISLAAYRLVFGRPSFQSPKERRWFTVAALPLMTFVPVGLLTAGLAFGYCRFAKAAALKQATSPPLR